MRPIVLGLGTYPIRRPVHGGQRRVAALRAFYDAIGIDYRYVAVYQDSAYGAGDVDDDDAPHRPADDTLRDVPHVSDLDTGVFAATDAVVFPRFERLVARLRPAAFQLEQPWMWPLVKRLRARSTPVIYSSQNVEGLLKESIIRGAGGGETVARAIGRRIEALETEAANAATLVIAVSEADARFYRRVAPGARVLVVRNGVDRPQTTEAAPSGHEHLEGRRFLFFVGSAYPPNIEGFAHFVLTDGLFFLAPETSVAICGGVSDGIFAHDLYQRHLGSYSRRVLFFPKIDDGELAWLKSRAHAMLLPIRDGGGSNLKTAEALASGAAVIASRKAMRSFEEFATEPGVAVVETPEAFTDAMVAAWHAPRLSLSAAERERRESVYWDRCFAASPLAAALDEALGRSGV